MSILITLNELLTSLTLFVQRSTFRYNSSPCLLQNIASRVASSAEENGENHMTTYCLEDQTVRLL